MTRTDRRQFLINSAACAAAALGLTEGQAAYAQAGIAAVGATSPSVLPGPYPGTVVDVFHPGSVVGGSINPDAVREMMQRGMLSLTGASDVNAAWRRFVSPGDVVGIKVNPVGWPHAISNYAVVLEIIDSLRLIGLPPQDILVFDRYHDDFVQAGYPGILPAGVRWATAAKAYEPVQLDIAGYDPDVFLEVPLVAQGIEDPNDPLARRSHVSLIVTQMVNKIISVPVLKDHSTAGVSLALKSMSHGMVNNVNRTHAVPAINACGWFIPAAASLPAIRTKVVLQILDGLKGVYEGGPFADTLGHVWEQKTLSFATDPVALDRLGWQVIDAKRQEMGLPPVGESKWQGVSFRQPEHIYLADALGLGESDLAKIEHVRITLGA